MAIGKSSKNENYQDSDVYKNLSDKIRYLKLSVALFLDTIITYPTSSVFIVLYVLISIFRILVDKSDHSF